MKVLLIPDRKSKYAIPPLMKLSTYHKSQGDEVGWHIPDPERIYVSLIFTESSHQADGLQFYYPDAEIIVGGSGYDHSSKLPPNIEHLKPDYSLYPDIDYSIGWTTRGCIRDCEFCIVREKEGRLKIHQHPLEFHDDKFKKIKLLDNNILGLKDWFFEVTDWLIQEDLQVEFNQGLDIRLLDSEIAERLNELKCDSGSPFKFAWDNMEDEKAVKRGISNLKDVGIDIKRKVQVYVLTNYNTTHKEDLYRCNELKRLGTNPFVMQYEGGGQFTRYLSRWANRKWLFWSIDFRDYDRLPLSIKEEVKRMELEKYADKVSELR